jgi:NAD(P)-dependent dehydrogenase (short-subunit alcohol dehydrogenase family)
MRLEDKVALVTGGGRGLGEAAARILAEEGARVVVADRDGTAAEKLAAEIRETGRASLAVAVDVSNAGDVRRMVSTVLREFDRIDVLLHCAGIARGTNQWGEGNWKPMEEVSEEDWDLVVDVNLKGTFLCDQAVGRAMIPRRSGKIINVGSISGVVANRGLLGHGPYCASKAGVIQLTRVLAMEWARYNIRVNCISPGYMETPMVERVRQNLPDVHRLQVEMTPMSRFGSPREFGRTAVFLASEDSDYITGHNLLMDGGYTIW